MEGNLNPRIVGACILGFALVAGAYVLSNFGQPSQYPQQAAVGIAADTPRVAIAVTDEDQNGLEDWRDEFVKTEPIVLDPIVLDEDYEAPTTLTGKLGVDFFEQYLRSKTYGQFGRDQEELISDTVDTMTAETAHDLFDTPDITIMNNWEPADVRVYANTIALAIMNNDIANAEGEMFVLHDILKNGATERVGELTAISTAYKNMRDQTLATPVPDSLIKEHLDLINTYHAIHKDVESMTQSLDDPAFTLMRMKRYEDDATGMGYALTNMYNALLPYAELVQPDDPALLFVVFSPDYKL